MTYMETHYPSDEPEFTEHFRIDWDGKVTQIAPLSSNSPVRMPSWMRHMARDGTVLPPLFEVVGVWD